MQTPQWTKELTPVLAPGAVLAFALFLAARTVRSWTIIQRMFDSPTEALGMCALLGVTVFLIGHVIQATATAVMRPRHRNWELLEAAVDDPDNPGLIRRGVSATYTRQVTRLLEKVFQLPWTTGNVVQDRLRRAELVRLCEAQVLAAESSKELHDLRMACRMQRNLLLSLLLSAGVLLVTLLGHALIVPISRLSPPAFTVEEGAIYTFFLAVVSVAAVVLQRLMPERESDQAWILFNTFYVMHIDKVLRLKRRPVKGASVSVQTTAVAGKAHVNQRS